MMFVLDLECARSEELLAQASTLRRFNKKVEWILFGKDFNESLALIGDLNINVDAKILLIITENEFQAKIYHIRCPALQRNGLMFVDTVGNFTKNQLIYKNPFETINYKLHSTILRVAICLPHIPPGTSFLEYASKPVINNKYTIVRAAYQLVKLFSEMYDFRIHLIRAAEYGMLLPNTSTWTGLAGMVQSGFVDFAAQSFVFSKARVAALDTGFSVMKYRQSFVFCHPKYTNQKNVFLMPLSKNVWISIFVVASLTIMSLIILQKMKTLDETDNSFVVSVINVIGLLAQQGLSSGHLNSVKLRIIIIFFLLLSFTIFQFYSASIVGSLLTPVPRTITSHKKLAESNFKFFLEDHPSSRLIFKLTTDDDILRLYERKIKGSETYVSITEGIQKIKEQNNVLLSYIDEIFDQMQHTLTHEEMDQIQIIPVFPQNHRALLWMPLWKDGPMNEVIRVANLKLGEVGIKKFVIDKYYVTFGDAARKTFDPAVVDFQRTASIFYALIVGIVISLVVFLVEIILNRYHQVRLEPIV
ncbi:glutamate receptor U1-like [Culicoides brevitarsis]|uniref:glutamate receptor U1-like n=1 Tax=Culicoides brevitarsis TaxID=469753 RepID=UPI00307C7E83